MDPPLAGPQNPELFVEKVYGTGIKGEGEKEEAGMRKKFIFIIFLTGSLLGFTACGKLNVTGDESGTSFEAMLKSMQARVTADDSFGGWSLQSPDREARFLWSRDFSKTSADAMLEFDARPFLDAGLDMTKLPADMVSDNKIIIVTDLGDEKLTYLGQASPLDSYKKLAKHYRNNIAYHTSLDHFGIDLGNGNMFQWAKNMKTNDKDIVFVLNPQPFLDAGVDPDALETWFYDKIEIVDTNGEKVRVDKFLKPFDVES